MFWFKLSWWKKQDSFLRSKISQLFHLFDEMKKEKFFNLCTHFLTIPDVRRLLISLSSVRSAQTSFELSIIYQKRKMKMYCSRLWGKMKDEESLFLKLWGLIDGKGSDERKGKSFPKFPHVEYARIYWHINFLPRFARWQANKNKIDLWCVAGEAYIEWWDARKYLPEYQCCLFYRGSFSELYLYCLPHTSFSCLLDNSLESIYAIARLIYLSYSHSLLIHGALLEFHL